MISNPLLFLRRIRHCAGFGIQSPTDYAFVRKVIYERWPYAGYADLEIKYPEVTPLERWKLQLLLRVANYAQAERVFMYGGDESYTSYLHAGCKKTVVRILTSGETLDSQEGLSDGDLIVVNNLQKSMDLWKSIKSKEHIIAFDLYHLGLAFCKEKRYSECHIINPY